MEKKLKIIGICLGCIIIPVFIGMGVSADILNEWTNSNDWIGFWGSYAGAVVGGLVTLFVMYETNKVTKENEKRKEQIDFCNLVIEKMASITENVEETLYQACECERRNKIIEALRIYSKQLRVTRTIILELYMHFDVVKEQQDYISELAKKISELLWDLYKEMDEYYKNYLQNITYDEKKLFDKVNVIDNEINTYIKELFKTQK